MFEHQITILIFWRNPNSLNQLWSSWNRREYTKVQLLCCLFSFCFVFSLNIFTFLGFHFPSKEKVKMMYKKKRLRQWRIPGGWIVGKAEFVPAPGPRRRFLFSFKRDRRRKKGKSCQKWWLYNLPPPENVSPKKFYCWCNIIGFFYDCKML